MLIDETFADVATAAGGNMRELYISSPSKLDLYANAIKQVSSFSTQRLMDIPRQSSLESSYSQRFTKVSDEPTDWQWSRQVKSNTDSTCYRTNHFPIANPKTAP